MSGADDIVRFFANHVIALLIAVFVIAILLFFFLLTPTGQAGIKLMSEQPLYIVLLFALLMIGPVVYLIMLRPQSPDVRRAPPEEVWDAIRVRYSGHFMPLALPEEVRHDDIDGTFFTVKYASGRITTAKFSDIRGKNLGMLMDGFKRVNTDEEIDGRRKKTLGAEERLQRMAQDKQYFANVEEMGKRAEQWEEIAGKPANGQKKGNL